MPEKLGSCLTYANVMATVAVFVALGGSESHRSSQPASSPR